MTKGFRFSLLALGAVAVALASSDADAQEKVRLRTVPGKAADAAAPATPTPTPAAPAAADAGVKEKGKEGPEQKKRRQDYVARISKEVRAIVRSDGVITAEEKELVRQHWRRSMRAHRIRLLAEDENNAAIVARVDAYLAKIEKTLMDHLKELNKKGAAKPAAADGGAK